MGWLVVATRDAQARDSKERHDLGAETWRGPQGSEILECAGDESELFMALASGACLRILSRLQAACGQFPQETSRRVPVLPDQQHPSLIVQWDQDHRTLVPYDFEIRLAPVWQTHAVDRHVEDAAFIDGAAGQDGCSGVHRPTLAARRATPRRLIPSNQQMTHALRELRYVLRQLRQAPVFTAAAVLTIGLGIGGTTAIFTLIHAVMLRSLPVHDPALLYRIGDGNDCCVEGGPQDRWGMISYQLFKRLT